MSGFDKDYVRYKLEVVFDKENHRVHLFPLIAKKEEDADKEAQHIISSLVGAMQECYELNDKLLSSNKTNLNYKKDTIDNLDLYQKDSISFRVIELN
jgi:hypothetical protein